VRWWIVRRWQSTTIGKECAGARYEDCSEQGLASNVLAQGVTMEERVLARSVLADCVKMAECNYWRGVHWRKARQWKSALAEEVVMTEVPGLLGDKCDLWKVNLGSSAQLKELK
jgi:hypothetical protein